LDRGNKFVMAGGDVACPAPIDPVGLEGIWHTHGGHFGDEGSVSHTVDLPDDTVVGRQLRVLNDPPRDKMRPGECRGNGDVM
jgi:hypothetical protein